MINVNTFGEFSKLNENSDEKFNFMMLSRLQSDCEYFLNHGKGSVRGLHYDTVEEHIAEMKKLWNSFDKDNKPNWLTFDQIEQYEKDMLSYDD